MKALEFTVDCPDCGGTCQQLAQGVPTPFRTNCTITCDQCKAEFLVTVNLSRTRAGRRPTPAGCRDHTYARPGGHERLARDADVLLGVLTGSRTAS